MEAKQKHSKILYNRKFSSPMKRKRKNAYDPEEEARLESKVFGGPNFFINDLLNKKPATKAKHDESSDELTDHGKLMNNKKINTNCDDDSSVVKDTEDASQEEKQAAWRDDDDYNYTVNTALDAQNRRLACEQPEKSYSTYLKNHYKIFVGTPKWAELKTTDETNDDSDVTKHCRFLAEKSKPQRLPKDMIDIKALKSLNNSTRVEGHVITSVEFHPTIQFGLIASTKGMFAIYQVDGHTNPNKFHVWWKYDVSFPISKATFLKNGTEVLCGSKYHDYGFTYHLPTDQADCFPLPHGITNMELFEVSPNGDFIALCGRRGEIFLLHSQTKELIWRFNMNSKCRALVFTPDNKNLITYGDGGEMYIWDLGGRRCIHRAIDDGCLSGTALAISSNGQYLAAGSAQGVVNLYETKTVLHKQNPTPVKSMMNLVTCITSLRFNPTCEILAAASDKKYNAFKMMHLPSLSVFANFPGFQTNIGMPQAMDFSPGSGYLSISNKTGTALLFRLRHYAGY
ncbi:PREDICTED: U3 small nucleolar RNA-associated protein 18 homolog [Dinoponera quadriceps]|uniref:U3 small nucleolar RNA-associated protein 18 homolog n=1 Tax=Dinoponera quadriceps TaxID=609295 RepID=A0A6P3XFE5_DINQU|nr:PREDICTED: U3 small nucleolar RNA-associated protein 18 homolog [Dinoponera quadriceps]